MVDLKSPAKLPTGYITEQLINQIRKGATCRPIETRIFRRRKIKIDEQVMSSAKQQRLCARIKPHVIFMKEAVASLF